jgi:hypothetical protein
MSGGKEHVHKSDVAKDHSVPHASNTPNGINIPVDPLVRDRFLVQLPVNPGSVSSASPDRKVDDLFRQVFRGKVPDKPLDIVDKLSQVVRARKVEGRGVPEFEFSPVSSAAATSSAGGQSVAQTSLYERAQAAFKDAEKRLAALKPMQTPSDPENLDALRAVTLTTYKRLVTELGLAGGPREKRADRQFNVLIGAQAGPDFKLGDSSLLKQIEVKFKLENAGVNSAEDSANIANFRIVRDNLFDVFRSWNGFNKDREGDFSEQAGKFSRVLALIQDDVTDVETALDEVSFDVTDRDSELVKANDELTINGLLTWIREFAAEEAPEMIDGGGAIGIAATFPTLEELEASIGVLKSLNEAHVKEQNVQAGLDALKRHLTEAKLLAYKIRQAIQ